MRRGVVGKALERRWRDWVRKGFGFGFSGGGGGGGAESDGFCCCVSSSKAFVSISASVCQWKAGRESRAMKARGR